MSFWINLKLNSLFIHVLCLQPLDLASNSLSLADGVKPLVLLSQVQQILIFSVENS